MAERIEPNPDGDIDIVTLLETSIPERYRPKPGKLFWLQPEEADLIVALRADPDQERHLADCRPRDPYNGMPTTWNRANYEVVVRHPITERLLADALFSCPALEHAEAWLDDEDEPVGRWRMDAEGATWERIAS